METYFVEIEHEKMSTVQLVKTTLIFIFGWFVLMSVNIIGGMCHCAKKLKNAVKKQKGEGSFTPHKRTRTKNDGIRRGIRIFVILLLWAAALFIILTVEKKILTDLLTWKSWAVN